MILGLSEHTVRCYLKSALHKLNAVSDAHAVSLDHPAGLFLMKLLTRLNGRIQHAIGTDYRLLRREPTHGDNNDSDNREPGSGELSSTDR